MATCPYRSNGSRTIRSCSIHRYCLLRCRRVRRPSSRLSCSRTMSSARVCCSEEFNKNTAAIILAWPKITSAPPVFPQVFRSRVSTTTTTTIYPLILTLRNYEPNRPRPQSSGAGCAQRPALWIDKWAPAAGALRVATPTRPDPSSRLQVSRADKSCNIQIYSRKQAKIIDIRMLTELVSPPFAQKFLQNGASSHRIKWNR